MFHNIIFQCRCSSLGLLQEQHAKKVVFDSPGLVDFVIRLVNSVLILPDGQMIFFRKFT